MPCPQNVEIDGLSAKSFKISFCSDEKFMNRYYVYAFLMWFQCEMIYFSTTFKLEMHLDYYDEVRKCHTKPHMFIITFPNFHWLKTVGKKVSSLQHIVHSRIKLSSLCVSIKKMCMMYHTIIYLR